MQAEAEERRERQERQEMLEKKKRKEEQQRQKEEAAKVGFNTVINGVDCVRGNRKPTSLLTYLATSEIRKPTSLLTYLATSEIFWSGGRGILTELRNCLCFNAAGKLLWGKLYVLLRWVSDQAWWEYPLNSLSLASHQSGLNLVYLCVLSEQYFLSDTLTLSVVGWLSLAPTQTFGYVRRFAPVFQKEICPFTETMKSAFLL